MSRELANFLEQLEADEWRGETGFSPEISEANLQIEHAQNDAVKASEILSTWIQHHQPCLFGRVAAKADLLSYCVLNESVILQSDEAVYEMIQKARLEWTREAFEGRKSGFILFVNSPRIVNAKPSQQMRILAQKLCSLYLQKDVPPDTISLEEIYLEMPGSRHTTWRWYAGVNYFSSHGDRRWWRDHRIPGGMAFSVNSIGHMAKSGLLSRAMSYLEKQLGAPEQGWVPTRVDSLETALEIAMRTISLASDGVSGKATWLLARDDNSQHSLPSCPIELPPGLIDKNHCEYAGYYHTDYTIPSEYFRPDVTRPSNTKIHALDFTYLFLDDIDNPEHESMGTGHQIREDTAIDYETTCDPSALKRGLSIPVVENIGVNERLVEALGSDRIANC